MARDAPASHGANGNHVRFSDLGYAPTLQAGISPRCARFEQRVALARGVLRASPHAA